MPEMVLFSMSIKMSFHGPDDHCRIDLQYTIIVECLPSHNKMHGCRSCKGIYGTRNSEKEPTDLLAGKILLRYSGNRVQAMIIPAVETIAVLLPHDLEGSNYV